MRKCILLFIVTTCLQLGFVQFTDYFKDGDFTNNTLFWGESENSTKLKTDMYIFFILVFSEDGEVDSYKKVVALHN